MGEDGIPKMREGHRIDFGATKYVEYVRGYGGFCRDCADENGVCPNSGLPCDRRRKAIGWVLDALSYGLSNGFIEMPEVASGEAAAPRQVEGEGSRATLNPSLPDPPVGA